MEPFGFSLDGNTQAHRVERLSSSKPVPAEVYSRSNKGMIQSVAGGRIRYDPAEGQTPNVRSSPWCTAPLLHVSPCPRPLGQQPFHKASSYGRDRAPHHLVCPLMDSEDATHHPHGGCARKACTHQTGQGHQRCLNLGHVSILKKVVGFEYVVGLHAVGLNSFNEVADVLQLLKERVM